jgi:hypothetical protein
VFIEENASIVHEEIFYQVFKRIFVEEFQTSMNCLDNEMVVLLKSSFKFLNLKNLRFFRTALCSAQCELTQFHI